MFKISVTIAQNTTLKFADVALFCWLGSIFRGGFPKAKKHAVYNLQISGTIHARNLHKVPKEAEFHPLYTENKYDFW